MKVFKYFSLIVLIVFMFSACDDIVTYNKDYNDGMTPIGPPKITSLSPVGAADSIITSGELNQMVIIHGENLSQVQSIMFNDKLVDISKIYAVNNRITLTIPATEPDQITNLLTIITSKGTTTFSFEVKFPPLMITGFSHEFANAGDEVDIYGQNFLIYGLSTETADIEIDGKKVAVLSASQTNIRIVIPEGISDNAKMTFSSDKLLNRLNERVELTYRDTGYPIVDLGLNAFTHPALKEYATNGLNPGDPSPIEQGMTFLRFSKKVDPWSWNFIVNFYQFNLKFDSIPFLTDFKVHAVDYEFKFEINISESKAITNPSDQLIVSIKNSKGLPDENDVNYIAASTSLFHTKGRWLTMKLLEPNRYVKEDGSTILLEEDNNIAIALTNSSGFPITPDFSMTNFRISKRINIVKAPK